MFQINIFICISFPLVFSSNIYIYKIKNLTQNYIEKKKNIYILEKIFLNSWNKYGNALKINYFKISRIDDCRLH